MANCSLLGDERRPCSTEGLGLGRGCPSGPCANAGKGGVPWPRGPSRRGGGRRPSSPVVGRPGAGPRSGGGRRSRCSPSAVGGLRGGGPLRSSSAVVGRLRGGGSLLSSDNGVGRRSSGSGGGRLSSRNGGGLLSPGGGVPCCMPGGRGDRGGIWVGLGDCDGRGGGGVEPFFLAARASAVARCGLPPVSPLSSARLKPLRIG